MISNAFAGHSSSPQLHAERNNSKPRFRTRPVSGEKPAKIIVAHHHVSDNYIALFSHFIPCGVWEAIYILDGLTKNDSDIQPDTLHGDTQAQSTPVFGLAYLLGIKLMPRIRN